MAERGRPSIYSEELAARICERLAAGETLIAICRDEDMPAESTVRGWALDDREGFSAKYARAREIGYHHMADEIQEISDNGSNDWMERNDSENAGWQVNGEHIQRSRLRVDSRKWHLSKALPKIYGDRQQHEHSGPDGGPIHMLNEIDRAARIASLLGKAVKRKDGAET